MESPPATKPHIPSLVSSRVRQVFPALYQQCLILLIARFIVTKIVMQSWDGPKRKMAPCSPTSTSRYQYLGQI